MRQARTSRFAVLGAVALVAVFASAVKPAKSADKAAGCSLNLTGFAQVAFFTDNGVTRYQYAINFQSGESVDDGGSVSAELYGGGGNGAISYDPDLTRGANRLVVWTNGNDYSAGRKEKLSLSMDCSYNSGPTEKASTKLYKPGQAQPFVQPWVNGCPDWLVVDSRGSGEPLGTISPPGAVFVNQLHIKYLGDNPFGRDFVIESLANPYPAKGKWADLLAAKAHLPLAYHHSVVTGKRWLASELPKVHSHCHRIKVYLVGYSQGAQVAGDVYQQMGWHIAGLVLFGDPSFNGSDTSDRLNYSPVHNGALHKRPAFNSRRVWSFCHQHDPVCQGVPAYIARYRFHYHNNYTKHGEPQRAADYFVG